MQEGRPTRSRPERSPVLVDRQRLQRDEVAVKFRWSCGVDVVEPLCNLDEHLVQRLKRRSAANGRSTEEEHRQLLAQVLRPEGLGKALLPMPKVDADADFEWRPDLPRELDLQ